MRQVTLDKIRIDGGTQPRAEINQLVVDDYAESMRAGSEFPPVTLFFDGVDYWLADGFHRYHATRAADLPEIAAKIEKGTQRDAILFSVGANASHGLRRTNLDKRRAVGILLADKEWVKRSDRWIAEKCGVDGKTVATLRAATAEVPQSRVGQDGKERALPAKPPRLTPEERARLMALSTDPADDPEEVFAPIRDVFRGLPAADDRSEFKALEKLDRPTQAAVVERLADGDASTVREAVREVRRTERLENLAEISKGNTDLATGTSGQRYPVIYADPPWRYEHCESESRAIENQYPTMDLAEICALPVSDVLATDDAILFLWATSPKLAEALQVMAAWGFSYRTCAVWDKSKIGMGYYFRQRHELLLVGTRGSPPAPPPDARPASVFVATRGEHSAKPDEFRKAIERMYPTLPRVEMFCRSAPKGWATWGNQAGGEAA